LEKAPLAPYPGTPRFFFTRNGRVFPGMGSEGLDPFFRLGETLKKIFPGPELFLKILKLRFLPPNLGGILNWGKIISHLPLEGELLGYPN